jgi:GNAT superfamily N-acetyltransferase
MAAGTPALPRIRPMRPEDAAEVAVLSGQLGYPATTEAVARRFATFAGRADLVALVAEDAGGALVGWIQAHAETLLESDPIPVIGGLVVRESARGRGIGRALLEAVEAWAAARGYPGLRVRSNVVRERAHRFYERAGYARTKTQHNFTKPLAGAGGGHLDP